MSSNDLSISGKPKVRRTQEERSASTRRALLDATIATLHEHGYGATTTSLVADTAGMSRGAMLHQFRTKAELMTFVVEEVANLQLAEIERLQNKIADPRERVLALPEIIWKVYSTPAGVAALEIIQGSRSDPQLTEMLRPIQKRIERVAVKDMLRDMGGMPPPALLHLLPWAIRGLSISNVVAQNGKPTREAVAMLRTLIEAGLQTGAITIEAPTPRVNA